MRILPRPNKVDRLAGEFVIDSQTSIFCCEQFKEIANGFVDMIYQNSGLVLQFVDGVEYAQIIFVMDESYAPEGYTLNIAQGGLTVTASTKQGCFYAVMSLCQILDLHKPNSPLTCMNYYIEDSPKFAYRGLHLDICRHFFGVDTIKQIIKLMSQVKLNKLHLHLSDDQGFRVQIDKYPKLTQVGSVRSGSEVVRDGERFVEEIPHSGYLTKQDIAQIIQFASDHFVEVIPELDIPGHMVAALAAYPEYSCTGKVSEVRKNWGISKDILCAGNDQSYTFVCDILDEICQMFPSNFVHLGGDEAPKDRWCNCEKCVAKLAELKMDTFDQLQNYMLEFFVSYLEQQGKKVICWNDGIINDTSMSVISQVWKPFTRKKGAKQANQGRQTIMSPFFSMYFDYPYAMTPLKRTLKFNPTKGVKAHNQHNVLGVEGAVWTEYIASDDKLFFNLLPRLDALANCGWGRSTKKFAEALKGRIEWYNNQGIACNEKALGGRRCAKIIKKFFKVDANVELSLRQKRLQKQSSKQK